MHWSCERNKNEIPIEYVLIIEHPAIDGRLRRQLRQKIYNQLPYKLREKSEVKREVLPKFEVINLDEGQHNYPKFKTTGI